MSIILRGGGAEVHASAAPGQVDYVLDEVKADSTAVAVFDGAASATLAAQTVSVGASSLAPEFGDTAIGYAAQCTGAIGGGLALGWQARAGDGSVALGADSRALAGNSITIGVVDNTLGATASGAISVGRFCSAAGVDAVALGNTASAAGVDSVAAGRNATAGGGTSVALGAASAALNNNGVAIGIGNAADPYGARAAEAIAAGSLASATAEATLAIGANTSATGIRGVAVGGSAAATEGAKASGLDSIAIGSGSQALNSYDIAIGKSATCSGLASVCLGAGTSGSTFTDVIVLGSSNSGAVVAATTATANGDVIIGSGGSGAAGFLKGNQITSKHLSPAVASAVALGTSALPYSSVYVDAVYPRSRAADFARVNAVQSSGAAGTYFTTTGGGSVTFPNSGASFTTSITQPAGSAFSNASTASAIAISYNGTAGYANLRVTCHLPTIGTDAGGVQAFIGTGATLGTLATYGSAIVDLYPAGAGLYAAATIREVVPVSGVIVVGVLWRKIPGGTARAGNASGTQLGTLIVEQL